MKEKKKHTVFIQGPISASFIADSIAKHSSKTEIGAHSIFLGQVRSDVKDNKIVKGIEYSAYTEMAEDAIYEIREQTFSKYKLTCMHIYHSIGTVNTGELCLFVFVSAKHRKEAFDACEEIVEHIKKDVPIWGKEIFEDNSAQWKENTISQE